MVDAPYLIVGGGLAADSAVQGIREVDPSGRIVMVSAEPDPPYNRPPLSKGLWKGDLLDSIWRDPDARKADVVLGRTMLALDPAARTCTDDRGETYAYEKLLLATGGTPRRLPFGGGHVIYYRTLRDYRRLRELADTGRRFAVIGGGFIGSEVAAALAMQGKEVTMAFPEETLAARVFPADMGRFLNEHFRSKGVTLLPGHAAQDCVPGGGGLVLRVGPTGGGAPRDLPMSGVVAGLGITPDTGLAKGAGLAVENGIVVDEFCRAGNPHVFAAGDVAAYPSATLGRRVRVEHEDNAAAMGRQAGRNMAGAEEPYRHVPMFYSDLFELGYEAVGELDSRLETVADWHEPYRQGVVYYLREGRVRGVLLWNVWGQVDAARALLADPGPHPPEGLKGRIPAEG